ncbi:MAG: efflux RND transporter periplasmic adaptor subunit [Deferribacteres bacterium]|nr:efflux RND transporter periplasmic adaptor subunit [candidate division KSB1 bacterium]MCB9501657.1 efflux RND transporter periplasmic adaptor subunit [Deferribacteres bacterium]
MNRLKWHLFIWPLALLLIATACENSQQQKETSQPTAQITVATAHVQRDDIIDTIAFYGRVELRQEARVGSQFDGRIDDFSLLPGDRVAKGQKIGSIIPPSREALLQVLPETSAQIRTELEKQSRVIPLLSPITGVVLEVTHQTGDVVQKSEQIVRIGDLRELDIRGDLPLRYLPIVRQRKEITVTFIDYPQPPMQLPLRAIAGDVNENNQTIMIRLKLGNPEEEYRPGMLVKLIFEGERHTAALTIPRAALLEEEGVYSVFILKNQKVEKRDVEPGILQDDKVEILSGLSENELVVTTKAYSLDDGMEVLVK